MTGARTPLTIDVNSEEETMRLGLKIATHLQAGDAVALIGPLGAGKTRLVQAIAQGLDVPRDVVNSPTFVLIQEYAGRIPLRHCDAYRLKLPQEFPELGLDDLFAADGIALVEWADRVTEFLPEERLEIRLEPTGLTSRRASLIGHGRLGSELISRIEESLDDSNGTTKHTDHMEKT